MPNNYHLSSLPTLNCSQQSQPAHLSTPQFPTKRIQSLVYYNPQEDRGALPALLALTETAMPTLQAKAIVAVALYCRGSPLALLAAVQARLAQVAERLARSDDTYICYALKALSSTVADDVDQIIDDVSPCFHYPGHNPEFSVCDLI